MDILSNELFPFTVAASFMVACGLVQVIGLDLDIDLDADANYLGWLGVGRVPFMMLLTLALGLFAFIGYALAIVAPGLFSATPSFLVAAGCSLAGTALLSPALARIIPQDETTSIRLEELIRRRATIFVGNATAEHPAQAKAEDHHGRVHTIWVKAIPGSPPIGADEEVLLVDFDQKNRVFTGTRVDSVLRALS